MMGSAGAPAMRPISSLRSKIVAIAPIAVGASEELLSREELVGQV